MLIPELGFILFLTIDILTLDILFYRHLDLFNRVFYHLTNICLYSLAYWIFYFGIFGGRL